MATTETTLVILKPDTVERRLIGEILRRFERKGLKVLGLKLTRLSREVVARHYEEHRGRPFYDGLVEFMSGGPVVLLALQGPHAIEVTRKLIGATAAHEAEPGTIRGDLGLSGKFNLVHGSDSPQSAAREVALFFEESELGEYSLPDEKWLE
jgi:nucleoside-diphosphate kinase